MTDIQKKLQYLTKIEVLEENYPRFRAVMALWKEECNTACISFYFNGKITEEDLDVAANICVYIISHFSNGLLEEHFIQLDYPQPLPKSSYWAYLDEKEKDLY